jgi:GTPase SAR1 family protein
MGVCGSKLNAEDVKNRQIDRAQNSEMKHQDEIIKLLLLGAGESGKSTIFRQMKILYGKQYTEEEFRNMIPVVHANILSNFLTVLQNAAPKGIDVGPKDLAEKFLTTIDEESVLNEPVGQGLKTLWADPGVQQVWAQRSSFQVLDSLEHYMKPENIDRIHKPNYVPTQDDILHARVRTSGIVEDKYIIDGVNFTMFDVGGQRNERKKWIHAFDGVTAVIFVAALNEYDLVLYEDNKTSRIAEAVKLFDEISNSQWFAKTSIILFLNKSELFSSTKIVRSNRGNQRAENTFPFSRERNN